MLLRYLFRVPSETNQQVSLLCLTCLQSFIEIGAAVQELSRDKQTDKIFAKSSTYNFDLTSLVHLVKNLFYESTIINLFYRLISTLRLGA